MHILTRQNGYNARRNPRLLQFFAGNSITGGGGITTVAAPAGIIRGHDLIVITDIARSGSALPTAVVPSGFTQIATGTASFARMITSAKIADGTEGGTNITGMNGDTAGEKLLAVIRANRPINAFAASTPTFEGTNNNPAGQNIAAASGVLPLVAFAGYKSNGTINPATFSPAEDGTITPVADCLLKYKIYNLAPSDISIDMDDEGDRNMLFGFYLSIS